MRVLTEKKGWPSFKARQYPPEWRSQRISSWSISEKKKSNGSLTVMMRYCFEAVVQCLTATSLNQVFVCFGREPIYFLKRAPSQNGLPPSGLCKWQRISPGYYLDWVVTGRSTWMCATICLALSCKSGPRRLISAPESLGSMSPPRWWTFDGIPAWHPASVAALSNDVPIGTIPVGPMAQWCFSIGICNAHAIVWLLRLL